jgi:DNA-binding response OmpR family regulator
MRLLLIEDDSIIGEGVRTGLKLAGFTVDWVRDGQAATLAIENGVYDLLLLDLGLPRKDGMTLLRELRNRGIDLPVLVLTARDTVRDRVKGLDTGADDYVVKPFDLDELSARVRALLRRRVAPADPARPGHSPRRAPARPDRAQGRAGRQAGAALAARIRAAARAARAPRRGAVARAAGGAPVRLGRGGLEQCSGSPPAQPAPQARRAGDP